MNNDDKKPDSSEAPHDTFSKKQRASREAGKEMKKMFEDLKKMSEERLVPYVALKKEAEEMARITERLKVPDSIKNMMEQSERERAHITDMLRIPESIVNMETAAKRLANLEGISKIAENIANVQKLAADAEAVQKCTMPPLADAFRAPALTESLIAHKMALLESTELNRLVPRLRYELPPMNMQGTILAEIRDYLKKAAAEKSATKYDENKCTINHLLRKTGKAIAEAFADDMLALREAIKTIDEAVGDSDDDLWAKIFATLSYHFHWTPQEIGNMTPAQVCIYLRQIPSLQTQNARKNSGGKELLPAKPIEELLSVKDENQTFERKASMLYDYEKKEYNKDLKYIIAKTVAGFMNKEGGTLLIGVHDNGTVLGLENDYLCLNKTKDRDEYMRVLSDFLLSELGRETNAHFTVTIDEHKGKDICVVRTNKVTGSGVWLKSGTELPVRINNTTVSLRGKEASEYLRHRS